MTVDRIPSERLGEALRLIRETFSKFVAPYYTEEGVKEFVRSHSDVGDFDDAVFYGAFDVNGELAGVIAAVNDLSHIVAFYVCEKFQKQGVGRALFNRLAEDSMNSYVTVNASPYALEIYRRLGFVEAGETVDDRGMVYTPMMCVLRGIKQG